MIPARLKTSLKAAAIAALLAALSSCAVLRVDVDVYKGPLANDREVLTEQLAVMAIGAKPLLQDMCQEFGEAAGIQNSTIEAACGIKDVNSTNFENECRAASTPTINVHATDSTVIVQAPPSTVNVQATDSTVIVQAPPSTVIVQAPPSTVNVQATTLMDKDKEEAKRKCDALKKQYDRIAEILKLYGPPDADATHKSLDKLIQAFVTAAPTDREEKLKDLVTELVRFSQKVLTVTNLGVLNTPAKRRLREIFYPALPELRRGPGRNSTPLLQAIANTILVLSDDLIRERRHNKSMADGFDRELFALAGTEWRFDSFVAGIGADRDSFKVAANQKKEEREAAKKALVKAREEVDPLRKKAISTNGKTEEDEAERDVQSAQVVRENQKSGDEGLNQAYVVLKKNAVAVKAYLAKLADGEKPDTSEKFLEAVKSWVHENPSEAGVLAENFKPGESFLTGLKDDRNVKSLKFADIGAAFDKFVVILSMKFDAASKKIGDLDTKVATAEAYVKAVKNFQAKIDAFNDKNSDLQKYDHAVEVLKALKTPDSTTSGNEAVPLAQRMFTALKEAVEAKKKLATDGDEDKYKDTLEVLKNDRTASLLARVIPDGFFKDGSRNRVAVLDSLITQLEYQYIQAVQEAGVGKGNAPRLADTLKAAYEYRSGMAYIRPAGTYLRSSLAAASLQRDSGANSWRNNLGDQMVRNIPVLDEWWINLRDYPGGAVAKSVDKQFWQTINSVRLSGGGKGNMVLAKDDIGNWYAKSYSSDPKPIIAAAKSLALYNAGIKLGANLLQPGVPGTSAADSTALGRLHTKYAEAYIKDTNATHGELVTLLGGDKLINDLNTAVVGGTKDSAAKITKLDGGGDMKKALKAASKELKESTQAENDKRKEAEKIDQGQAIVDGLIAIQTFRLTANAKIEAQLAEADATKANKTFNAIITGHLKNFLTKRKTAVNNYENAVMFIGEAAE